MIEAVVITSLFLAFLTGFSIVAGLRAKLELGRLKKKVETDQVKLKELDEKVDALKTNFMKVLRPIRQTTEILDEHDDEITRMQKRIDEMTRELKKREENLPPSST